VRLHARDGSERTRILAKAALDTLEKDTSSGTEGWGYPFDMQTRWSFYPANMANIIATSFAAAALQEGGHLLDEPAYLARAERAATWVRERLFRASPGFFVYYPGGDNLIHNANLLGARLVWTMLGDRESALSAVKHTLDAQRPDGGFPYGVGVDFVDSFHTGYVLDCLAALRALDPQVEDALARGTRYYVDRFFGPAGETPLWPDREFPVDAHAAGTAMTTLATLERIGSVNRAILATVGGWALQEMVRGDHAIFRRYRHARTHVQYLRWVDSHMALGLASAAAALDPSLDGQFG
jgi:hypothetical protein